MSTQDDLGEAFAGESQANRRYIAFSAKAADEGLTQIAKLFKAAAAAETVHALAHFNVMGGVMDTARNLAEAVSGENYEHEVMYPKFIAAAKDEGNNAASVSFYRANAVEKIHEGLFTKAAQALEAGSDMPAVDIYVCQVCGNTVEAEAPEACPICGAPRAKFDLIN